MMSEQARVGKDRNQAIELLRILGAFGIVWYHSDIAGHEIAYASLGIFIIVSTYFESVRRGDRTLQLGALARRFLIPWLFWFAVYAALNLLRGKAVWIETRSIPESILYGSKQHLWYLPFIFVILATIRITLKAIPRIAMIVICAILCAIMALTIGYWRPWSLEIGPPVAQYMQGLLAVFFGVVLSGNDRILVRVIIVMLVGAIAYAATLPYPNVGIPHLLAAMAVALTLGAGKIGLISDNRLESLSKLMFGVYLVHPIFLAVMAPLVNMSGPLGVTAVFVVSTLAIFVVRRFLGSFGAAIT